ncbi:MAG: corrinoid protein [Nitrospirota bacterium]
MKKVMTDDILAKLADVVDRGEHNEAAQLAKQSLEEGVDPGNAIVNGLTKGMALVSEKFDRHEYFVPELLRAARAMKSAVEVLRPHVKVKKTHTPAKVMIGTVADDIHDIGKNIVIMLLETAGYEVVDLGVDVSNEVFLSKAKETRPQVLGMSAVMTTTMPRMQEVISLLSENGIRNEIKVIIGGAPVTQKYADKIGADGYADNGPDAIRKISALVEQEDKMVDVVATKK